MPESIEKGRARRRREAVRGVTLFSLLQLACVVCFASLCFIPGLPGWAVVLFAALAVFCVLLIVPALAALKERFYEIEGGELDEARQY